MDYLFHILILINIYAIIAVSLNLIAGYSGLLSMAHAAFFGIGAYSTALMWQYFHTTFWINIWIGILFSIIFGFLIGYPSLRIVDDYFAIATFGFQMIFFSLLNNWVDFTNGPLGIPGIPKPAIFGLIISSHFSYFLLSFTFILVIYLIVKRMIKSPFGLILKGIREDEIFTEAAGKNIAKYKILIFIIGGSLASISGVLYAHYFSFVDPSSFTINESIFMLSIIIIGGMANINGSILGAIILLLLPELLRLIGIPYIMAANLRQIIYGVLLIALMLFRPKGIIGDYELS